jgi:uncharacterized membrane protein
MTKLMWSAAILLVLIGVTAAIARTAFVSDLAIRVEPVRERFLLSIGRDQRLVHRDPEQVRGFDRGVGSHRFVAYLHVIPGALFLALAPLQISSRIRTRHLRLHRRLGRVLMICALISGATGLFFGLFLPFGGWSESLVIVIVGVALFVSVARGFVAIRRGDVTTHREWMLRAFALCLGISTVRVVAAVLDVAGIPMEPRLMFVVSLWIGWILTLAVAELWIRYTRRDDVTISLVTYGG